MNYSEGKLVEKKKKLTKKFAKNWRNFAECMYKEMLKGLTFGQLEAICMEQAREINRIRDIFLSAGREGKIKSNLKKLLRWIKNKTSKRTSK